jgi:hypothetical protein
MGTPSVNSPFPFFKETEKNKGCCGCGNKGIGLIANEVAQVTGINPALMNTMPLSYTVDTNDSFTQIHRQSSIEMEHPKLLSSGALRSEHSPDTQEFEKYRTLLNMDISHRDK